MTSHTPLRRVSQGSLFALARSQQHPDAPHGLGFIEPAMSELVDEAEALHANVDNLHRLSHALRSFNESFASWLYVMDMNALTTDWLQAPTDVSFQLARKRAEEDARVAAEAAMAAQLPPVPPDTTAVTDADRTTYNETTDYETTFTTVPTSTSASTKSASKPVSKKKGKAKLTAKEKKERLMEIEKIVMCLPLEFRGSDPGLRRNMETVIEFMINSDGRGVKLIELITPPDLNQARVNKCLIALVNRKIVRKDNASYYIIGMDCPNYRKSYGQDASNLYYILPRLQIRQMSISLTAPLLESLKVLLYIALHLLPLVIKGMY